MRWEGDGRIADVWTIRRPVVTPAVIEARSIRWRRRYARARRTVGVWMIRTGHQLKLRLSGLQRALGAVNEVAAEFEVDWWDDESEGA